MAKIMIIEDNPVHKLLLCHVVEDLKHEPVDFLYLEKAKEELTKEKPALIIIDIKLHGSLKSSIDFIKELRETSYRKDIPIIIISAYASKDQIKEDLPFFDTEYVLQKPFNPETISAKVKALLKKEKMQ